MVPRAYICRAISLTLSTEKLRYLIVVYELLQDLEVPVARHSDLLSSLFIDPSLDDRESS